MEQELRRPEYKPRKHDRTSSKINCFLASSGVTLMTMCLVGSAAFTSVWAVGKVLGLNDMIVYVMMAIVAVPVLFVTVWTAGRSWYVEQRMSQGLDIDSPIFSTLYYFKKST